MVILDHGDMVIADSVHGDHRIGNHGWSGDMVLSGDWMWSGEVKGG